VALLCDAEGTILKVLRDDLVLGARLLPGRPFSLLVDRASLTKALDLLVDLQAKGATMGWELNVPTADRAITLHFAGAALDNRLLIVAAESDGDILGLYEELMGMHNEQTNRLRAALKEKAMPRKASLPGDAGPPAAGPVLPAVELEDRETALTPERRSMSAMYDELSRLNNELANLQRELSKKNAELERLNQLKDQFLGMAAHDLRTPLSVALGYSSFLFEDLGDVLDEGQQTYLSAIRSSCRFMLRLVDSLLDVAIIEAGRLELDRQTTDLVELVKHNVMLNRALAEGKRIQLTVQCDDSLPEMLLDGPRIGQVLNNLLSNACKFSYPDSVVEVHLARQGNHAILSVIDHGQGIAPDRLDDLFQWFARSRVTGTAGEKGTGLGLAIAQKIVEAHLGDIWVESELGQGATFYVSLPINEDL
jgi:signal transduction histidine kinase